MTPVVLLPNEAPLLNPPPEYRERGQDAAWWVWTLGQAAIVALYAGRVRLAGGYPLPVELTADLGLACGQLIFAVMLARPLLATPARIVRTAAVGVVMAVLAARLADRSTVSTLHLLLIVAVWMAVFGAFRHNRFATLMLVFLTIAGPVLYYASIEFSPQPIALGNWPTLLSPTLGVCTTRLHGSPWKPLIAPTMGVLSAFLTNVLEKRAAPL